MIKSISNRFDPNWMSCYEELIYPINPNRIIFWFELYKEKVIFCYVSEIPSGLKDHVRQIKNPSVNEILKVIDKKDIVVEGTDLRYLVEHYICNDLIVPVI